MNALQDAKKIVRDYIAEFDAALPDARKDALSRYAADDYYWRGMHPFYERTGVDAVVDEFWTPFLTSFTSCQRRMDFFFAGYNDCDDGASLWVVNAGNFMGLFDRDWLGIPSTGKVALLRYAEFHRIANGKIAETALFCDIISIMSQAGVYPLPPMTGHGFVYPGPRTHDGLLFGNSENTETEATLGLMNRLISDLSARNNLQKNPDSEQFLRHLWHEDMAWYGPYGIGATFTIPAYIRQHQAPFRENLADKTFNGHVARIAEGHYGGFFGWPNLNNKNTGGFLGMTSSEKHAPMRVVDLYRREGERFAENWIYIDLLHYLYEQGLDVLARASEINRTDYRQS